MDLPIESLYVRGDNFLILSPIGPVKKQTRHRQERSEFYSQGGSTKGYTLKTRNGLLKLPFASLENMPCTLSPGGKFVAVATKKNVLVYLADRLEQIRAFVIPKVNALAFSRDETMLACIGFDETTLIDIDSN